MVGAFACACGFAEVFWDLLGSQAVDARSSAAVSGKINLLGIIRWEMARDCGSSGLSSCSTQIELKSYYPVYFRVNAANGLALLFPRIPA